MNKNIKNRLKRTLILSLLAFIIGGGVMYYQINSQKTQVVTKNGINIDKPVKTAGISIGGPFTLTDHNGNKVTEKDFAEQYKLIYFGFTYCPAICPTELQKMVRVLEVLGPDAEKIQPIFITVDPERDTPEVMREYIALFKNEKLIGLTGTQDQIDSVKKSYRIFATKVQDENLNDYTVDHSSFTYLMSPDNELISIYRIKDSVEFMAKSIQSYLPSGTYSQDGIK